MRGLLESKQHYNKELISTSFYWKIFGLTLPCKKIYITGSHKYLLLYVDFQSQWMKTSFLNKIQSFCVLDHAI